MKVSGEMTGKDLVKNHVEEEDGKRGKEEGEKMKQPCSLESLIMRIIIKSVNSLDLKKDR